MKELLKYIGREALLKVAPAFKVTVRINDVKVSYGKVRFLIVPESGLGEMYVEQERLELK